MLPLGLRHGISLTENSEITFSISTNHTNEALIISFSTNCFSFLFNLHYADESVCDEYLVRDVARCGSEVVRVCDAATRAKSRSGVSEEGTVSAETRRRWRRRTAASLLCSALRIRMGTSLSSSYRLILKF